MDQNMAPSFAERQKIDERKYAQFPIKALHFSEQLNQRLRTLGAVTVADLLRMTPECILHCSEQGEDYLAEIHRKLACLDQLLVIAERPKKLVVVEKSDPTLEEIYKLDASQYSDTTVKSQKFSVRLYNILSRMGIETVEQLLRIKPQQLTDARGYGKTTQAELDAWVAGLETVPVPVAAEKQVSTVPVSIPANAKMLFPNDSIEAIPWSVRTINCLRRAGVETLEQMLSLSEDALFRLRNMGQKSVREVQYWQESLKVGADGLFCISDDSTAVCRWTPTAEQNDIMQALEQTLHISADRSAQILQNILQDGDVYGETLLYKIYENSYILDALRRMLRRILRHTDEGLSVHSLRSHLPQHLDNTTILEDLLLAMERDGEILEQEGYYRCKYPSLMEILPTLPERDALILSRRLNGETLEEVGISLHITRERVRQVEQKALKQFPRLEEDKYRKLFEQYAFSREDFQITFSEPDTTYNYLEMVSDSRSNQRKPLEEILEDDTISINIKKSAKRAIYKNYVHIDGLMVPKKRPDLVRHAVQRVAKNKISYEDFEVAYLQMLAPLGMDTDERYQLNGRTYSNHLSGCDYTLWNYNNAFRYYNITGTDFTAFLEALDLKQYNNMDLSTYKLFQDHPDLMAQYDIRDEYELHNLLKKIPIPGVEIHFSRMPNLTIGTASREEQALDLLIQNAPISIQDLAKLYEEAYGFRTATAMSSHFHHLAEYYHGGMYNIDFPALSTAQAQTMREAMVEDYYSISQVTRLFRKLFPHEQTNLVNSYNLKNLGFRVYSGYVIRNTYDSAKDYFSSFFTRDEILDLRSMNADFLYRTSFTTLMYEFRAKREIVEFAPKQYINIGRLRRAGCDKAEIENFCRCVADRVEPGVFFTIQSLRNSGFAHDLDDMGFEDYFYSALLAEDKDNFVCRSFGCAKLFLRGSGEATLEQFLRWLLERRSSIEIHDLVDLIAEEYGIKTDVTDLRVAAQDAGLYYDSIMKTIYIDYDTYFEEI